MSEESRAQRLRAAVVRLAGDVRRADEAAIAREMNRLSEKNPVLTPLAFALGGVLMVLGGVRLLLSNWRLTLIQLLPAVWIWLAMYDLRAHVLRGDDFHPLRGPLLLPATLVVVLITILAFFLNAVFGFAIARKGEPDVRRALGEARRQLPLIAAVGGGFGLALAAATLVAVRADPPWFAVSLSIVIAAMMIAYVALPSRLIGVERATSRRDRISASAVGGLLGFAVCTPPYLLGRIGLLMIGLPILRIPGFVVFALGAVLQAGATSAVRAVKMSVKLQGR